MLSLPSWNRAAMLNHRSSGGSDNPTGWSLYDEGWRITSGFYTVQLLLFLGSDLDYLTDDLILVDSSLC